MKNILIKAAKLIAFGGITLGLILLMANGIGNIARENNFIGFAIAYISFELYGFFKNLLKLS